MKNCSRYTEGNQSQRASPLNSERMDRKVVKILKKVSRADFKILPEVKRSLRPKIPVLVAADVRRHRIPLHEALLLELKEGNFLTAFNLYNRLIQHDHQNQHELTRDKELLEGIFEELKFIEFATKEEEIEKLLRLAGSIKKHDWITEILYAHACERIEDCQMEGTHWEAKVSYLYGKSLHESRKFEKSVSVLQKVFNLAVQHEDWINEVDDEKLFVAASRHLVEALLELSESLKCRSLQKALELASRSLKVLRSIPTPKRLDLEAKAEIQVGVCLMLMSENGKAQKHFDVAVELAEMGNFVQVQIDALLKKSQSFEIAKEPSRQIENLLTADDLSSKNAIPGVQAEICKMLAEIWVKQQQPSKALERFSQACSIYEKILDHENLLNVRMLMAPLIAEQKFGSLVRTIFESDTDPSQLSKLLLWQDRKVTLPSHTENDVEAFVKNFLDPYEITRVA